ncbi:archease [Elusimicrobiota bacterium]
MTNEKETGGFEEIEHTADIGLRLKGKDIEELFENGLKGLLSIVTDNAELSGYRIRGIKISAPDMESLLIDFLNEILFMINTDAWMPCSGRIQIDGNDLKAAIKGQKIDPEKAIKKEVKAATYHNIKIKETSNQLETEIFFDL